MEMSDLEQIWNKWTDTPTPSDIDELMHLNSKSVRDLVTTCLGMMLNAGLLPREKVAELGRSFGETLKYAMRGALILGLELSQRLKSEIPSSNHNQSINYS